MKIRKSKERLLIGSRQSHKKERETLLEIMQSKINTKIARE